MSYESWRSQVEGGMEDHRAHGKTVKYAPQTEDGWRDLYERQPRALYATWYVLTGKEIAAQRER